MRRARNGRSCFRLDHRWRRRCRRNHSRRTTPSRSSRSDDLADRPQLARAVARHDLANLAKLGLISLFGERGLLELGHGLANNPLEIRRYPWPVSSTEPEFLLV